MANNTLSSTEKAAIRDQKSAERSAKFDKLPKIVQFFIGLLALAVITVVGFSVFYAFDILLLDWDPIAKLVSAIF